MANVNRVVMAPSNLVVNRAGGVGHSLDAKNELVGILMTSLAEDTYYETADARNTRLGEVIAKVDPLFAAKAVIYARDVFGMRSITHIAGALLAGSQFPEKRAFYNKIVVRPDDALSILAAYGLDKPLPNAMKRGLADALSNFKAGTLAKYKSENREINMYDAINLVHPKSAAVNAFMTGEVRVADTWEVALSTKSATWRDLVLENKLGIMALLRNLRNIVTEYRNDSEVMEAVYDQLTNKEAIMRSRLFPYRFLAAYQIFMPNDRGYKYGLPTTSTIEAPQALLRAINTAAEVSLVNVPKLKGSTALFLDISGSMHQPMSRKSKMLMIDAGAMLGAMIFKQNPDSELIKFGTKAKKFRVNADMPLLEIANNFRNEDGLGYGTNLPAAFEETTRGHERVVIVSDMQTWLRTNYSPASGQQCWKNYNSKWGVNSYGYEIDLAGYGATALNNRSNREFYLPTVTDKIFTIMGGLEEGGDSLVQKIEKTSL